MQALWLRGLGSACTHSRESSQQIIDCPRTGQQTNSMRKAPRMADLGNLRLSKMPIGVKMMSW